MMSGLEEQDLVGDSGFSSSSKKFTYQPPDPGQEPGSSALPEKRSRVSEEASVWCCALCQGFLKNAVSTVCGHWLCGECITSLQQQSASSGHFLCPQCGKKPRTGSGDHSLLGVLQEHKNSLRQIYSSVAEGADESRSLTDRIYTELYVTEGPREEVDTQHEVTQLETVFRRRNLHQASVKHQDLFKDFKDNQTVKVVLTNGVAGIGKTFLVQKFTLDWAKGLKNQNIDVVIPLSFRELNLIRHEQHSLVTLLHTFYPTLQRVAPEKLSFCQLLFILDGLDESRISLNFNSIEVVTDVTQKSSVSVLLTNLIKGNLLPSALIWMTSRPAGARLVPPSCVDRVTELQGFTDAQIEKYFWKKFSEEELAVRICNHIKKFSSLHIMCRVPVFCWITATVLMSSMDQGGKLLPKTTTDLYSGFLLVQTKKKRLKYAEGPEASPQELMKANKEVLLKLGRLAFEHLEIGNILFYEEDLEKVGLDVSEAFVQSGLCTQIFKTECVLFQKPVYSFLHLSIQEFLAAVYMFHCYTSNNTEVLRDFLDPHNDQSFIDEDDSDEDDSDDEDIVEDDSDEDDNDDEDIVEDDSDEDDSDDEDIVKDDSDDVDVGDDKDIDEDDGDDEDIDKDDSDDVDVGDDKDIDEDDSDGEDVGYDDDTDEDDSVDDDGDDDLDDEDIGDDDGDDDDIGDDDGDDEDIGDDDGDDEDIGEDGGDEDDDKDGNDSDDDKDGNDNDDNKDDGDDSDEDGGDDKDEDGGDDNEYGGDEDENRYHQLSLDGFLKKALEKSLQSKNGRLDLVVRFLHGLALESNQRILGGLLGCTDTSPEVIQKVLKNLKNMNSNDENPDRSINIFHCLLEMKDFSILEMIQEFLKSEGRSGERLSAFHCSAAAYMLLMSEEVLDDLNLSSYRTSIEGKHRLIPAVRNCRKARLSGCELSAVHCGIVAEALDSEPSHLRELDLSGNYLESAGVLRLCGGLKSSNCKLEALWLAECEITAPGCALLGSALQDNPAYLKTLDLSANVLRYTGVKCLEGFLKNPQCILESLSLRSCRLPENSCDTLVSALQSNPSRLKHLELSDNELTDGGVRKLFGFLDDPRSRLETVKLANCHVTHESCFTVAKVLKSTVSHLRDLDLSNNELEDFGLMLLCVGLKSSHCRLEKLTLKRCGISDDSFLVSALTSNPSRLGYLDLRENDLQGSQVTDFVNDMCYELHTLRISDADGSSLKLLNEHKLSDRMQKGENEQPPGPGGIHFKENDGPEPASIQFDRGEKGLASGTHQECDASTDDENMNKGELESDGSYDPESLSQQQLECPKVVTEPRNLENVRTELWLISTKLFYSLECPGPGEFLCGQSGLGFVVSQQADLLFNIVPWDEEHLESAGLRAAGPLFNIECTEKTAVCELHLPHCQAGDAPNLEGLVCVHITEDECDVITPRKVTDTHVIVTVPRLSRFGLVSHLRNLWNRRKVARGQVLLFHRPPKPNAQKKILNVFLLPSNIPLTEVAAQQLRSEYIQAPSNCKLIPEQSYTLCCPEALKIQPPDAEFDTECGANYHPTYEILLPADAEEVSITVQDEERETVWKHDVSLTDAIQREEIFSSVCPEKRLLSVRKQMVKTVSEENLNQLLDELLDKGHINDPENETVSGKTRLAKARALIDMVIRKGSQACLCFIDKFCELDPHLSETLHLI